jgi:hypothetical protein
MKAVILYVTFFSILNFDNLYAQSVLQHSHYFTTGHFYPYHKITNVEFDSISYGGNNVVWDLSNATSAGLYDTMYTPDPVTTVFFNDPYVNYNLSNLCLYYRRGIMGGIDDSLYNYLISTPDSVNYLGQWAYNGIWETWAYHLTDPELYFTFPFSYSDSIADSLHGSAWDFSGLGLIYIHGRRTVQYDGYGTLILPGVTYNNCIRIKSCRTGLWTGGLSGININETYFTWFSESLNGPVLESMANSNFVQQTIHYFNNPTVNITEIPHDQNTFRIFPNPATDVMNIGFNGNLTKPIIVEMSDITGRVFLAVTRNSDMMSVNISGLNAGIYMVSINSGHTRSNYRLVKL